jgi:hypothetical protein
VGKAYRVMLGERESSKPSGRSRRRWIYDIKMGLNGIEWVNMADVRDK